MDSALIARGVAVVGVVLVAAACLTTTTDRSRAVSLALVGGRVQPAPDAPALEDGVVIVEGERITAVGPRSEVTIPRGARVVDCAGGTVAAGFWNSHVHFMGQAFQSAASRPDAQLAEALRAMLTSYGVTHAVDTGSSLPNTLALRERIERGGLPGPSILTAGSGFAPVGGSPYYILPARLSELASPADATALATRELEAGADAVKLFTGSWARPDSIVVMPVDIVRAAVEAAHARGKPVIAHPSNSAGARAAIEGGVDVLAHTFPSELDGRAWDRSLPARMRERGMALIPTLKLFPHELAKTSLPARVVEWVVGNSHDQLRAFAELGGQVLFGTDVGYVTDFDPTDEYVAMARAGLSYPAILAALTTAPAARWGAAARTGRVVAGMQADLVVLDGRPEREIRALARVRYTLRNGRVIYERTP